MSVINTSISTPTVDGVKRVRVTLDLTVSYKSATFNIYSKGQPIISITTPGGGGGVTFYIEDFPEVIALYPNSKIINLSIEVRYELFGGIIQIEKRPLEVMLISNEYTRPIIEGISIKPSTVLFSDNTLFVQNNNGVEVSFSSRGQLGAYIVNEQWAIEGLQYPKEEVTSGNFRSAGYVTVSFIATDSRGFSYEHQKEILVHPYSPPRVSPITGSNLIIAKRVDNNNNESDRGEGIYIEAGKRWTKILGRNTCRLQWRYKEESTWSDYSTLETNEKGDFAGRLPGTFARDKKYSIELSAIDELGVESAPVVLPIADAVFMHRRGTTGSISFGGRSTLDNAFEVYQDAYFRGGMGIITDGNLYNLTIKEVNGELVLVANQVLTYKEENNEL